MALPNSRDVTLGSGTIIPSTLLNNIQDMIRGGRHGSITRTVPHSAWLGPDASLGDIVRVSATSSNVHVAWFGMRPLDVIEDVQIGCEDDTGVNEILRFHMQSKLTNGISRNDEGTTADSDNSGGAQIVSLPSGNFPATIPVNEDYGVEAEPQTSFTWFLANIEVTYSH